MGKSPPPHKNLHNVKFYTSPTSQNTTYILIYIACETPVKTNYCKDTFLVHHLSCQCAHEINTIYLHSSVLGNKLTLETRPSNDGIDVRQELLEFHSTYYSSNLMGLCVLGRGKATRRKTFIDF